MIQFHCDKCGGKVRVPDQYAGKKGRCPSCKEVLQIPASSASDTAAPAAPANADAAASNLDLLIAAEDGAVRPEVPPGTVLGMAPPAEEEEEAGPVPTVVEKAHRAQATAVAAPAIPAPASAPAAAKPAAHAAQPAGMQKAKSSCKILFSTFIVCLVLLLMTVVLTLLRSILPDSPMPDERTVGALGAVLLILLVAGSIYTLLFIPPIWEALGQLPAATRLRGMIGGLGLLLMLLLVLAACASAILAQSPMMGL